MKPMSIRDVVGPIMVGPSSSHTAGALRIASMVRNLLDGEPAEVTFTLFGSFAHTYHGHGTDRALVAYRRSARTKFLRPGEGARAGIFVRARYRYQNRASQHG